MRAASSGRRACQANCSLNFSSGRAGVPHTVCPLRIVFASENAGLSTDDRAIFQITLFPEAGLSTHNYMLTKIAGAGESDLRGDHSVCADLAVVADVHEVIQLNAFGDARVVKRAAIDCGVRADLDIVARFPQCLLAEISSGGLRLARSQSHPRR